MRALRHRNYRLFFSGQVVSLIGTWMTTTAISWLVYRLTGSTLMLGLFGFAGQIPAFLFAPFTGVLVDRWNRHHVLVISQIAAMLQSFALAYLTLSGIVTIHWVIGLAVVQGVINAFDMPARQAFIIDMIEDRAALGNAIALNSSMVNVARLIGPAVAGAIIAATNEGWCFFIDGVSYLGVIGTLLMMTLKKSSAPSRIHGRMLSELREGWSYVINFRPTRSIIGLLALVSLFGMPYGVLMPVFAKQILHGGPKTLGILLTSTGLGALIGALWLATRRSVVGLGRLIPIAVALFGATLIAFSFSTTLWLSVFLLPFAGFGFIVQVAGSNTIVQTIVDEDKRGRVMSFFMMAFLGAAPFGSLIAGSLASRIGAPHTLLIGGMMCLIGSAWFSRELPEIRKVIRPIYEKMGIIPELAKGLQNSTDLSIPPEER